MECASPNHAFRYRTQEQYETIEIWRDVVRKRLSSRTAKEVSALPPLPLLPYAFFVAWTHGGLVSAENQLVFFDIQRCGGCIGDRAKDFLVGCVSAFMLHQSRDFGEFLHRLPQRVPIADVACNSHNRLL